MEITELLRQVQTGGSEAYDALMPIVYDELKRLAISHVRRESDKSPIEATSLVHEAYLRLVSGKQPDYQNRVHFFAIASRVMRQILVDAARARMAQKRGSDKLINLAE